MPVQIPEDVKKKMIEEAKLYSSATFEGLTLNRPEKYKPFRDGQDSGYSVSQQQLEEKEKEAKDVLKEVLANLGSGMSINPKSDLHFKLSKIFYNNL